VVGPFDIVEKYGTDAFRYWVAREANMFEDTDFSWDKFKESYNANLANGLGNLVSRVLKMAKNAGVPFETGERGLPGEFIAAMEAFRLQEGAHILWKLIAEADAHVQKTEPFRTIKTDEVKAKKDISYLL